ncbi:MAG: hypothetical protein M0R06_02600 [Sphaerochaeta sp.]|jgi:hypothetical protein|nr:hypothetical protein [Sphaerochaeta sp.]
MSITNAALAVISGLVGNVDTQTAFTYVANGSGSTAAAASQTALVSENANTYGFGRAAATVTRQTTTQTNDTVQFYKLWTATGSVTVREVGVFNASSSGTMLARTVLAADKSISSGETFALTYKVAFA